MKKKMLILIILASLIPGILAVVQYYENETKEAQNILKENTLNEKIDSLKLDNNDLKNELKLLLKDNTKLSHQLSETALKLNDNVIGNGDLEIKIKPLTNNEFNFKFINENDLAVNNATIIILEYNELIKCEIVKETKDKIYIKSDCYNANCIKYNGINFNPNSAFLANNKVYAFSKDYTNFSIEISTRKKTMIYYLVYKTINGELILSYRAYNYINQKEILVREINPLRLNEKFWSQNFHLKELFAND
jgi:hypothetical protein